MSTTNLSLPQHAPKPEARRKQLAEARTHYRYNTDPSRKPLVTMAATLPSGENFAAAWSLMVAEAVTLLFLNSEKILGNEAAHPHDEQHGAIRSAVSSGRLTMKVALDTLQKFVIYGDTNREVTGVGSDPGRRAQSLAEFSDQYREFSIPTIAHTDGASNRGIRRSLFAHLRLAGANPMQLHRGAPDARFPVTDAMYQAVMGRGDSLAMAAEEGRLYLTDYAVIDNLPGGRFPPFAQKYTCAPLGLFAIPQGTSDSRALTPVAIQLGQRPGPTNPIFTPLDGWGWRIAKTFLNSADGNVHQVVHHLSHTHLVLEPIVLATHRCLAEEHPVWALLTPHFDGTLAINEAAVTHLVVEGGGVDAVAAAQIRDVHALIAASVSTWSFKGSMLKTDLAARGVEDPEALPDYPYRDDALLVHEAIEAWVKSYVDIFYKTPEDVRQDPELQAWVTEISSARGGPIRDFGELETPADLSEALTHILFTASVQHAAVNFPQYDLMSYVPAVPLAAYAPPPVRKEGLGEQDYLAMLPPLEMAHYQLTLGRLLGGLRHTRLGHYTVLDRVEGVLGRAVGFLHGEDSASQKQVAARHEVFVKMLDEVEALIGIRNSARIKYDYLLPSRIPQSTNI